MSAAVVVGLLVTAGVYLVLQRELDRVVFGFLLLGHATNVLLLAAGGLQFREPPLVGQGVPADAADPLPQAFALTSIVITFGITIFLLVLVLRTPDQGDRHTGISPDEDPPGGSAEGDPGAPRFGTPSPRPDRSPRTGTAKENR